MPERREPTGVRFVLSNCAEPGREAELDEWYDAYAADCTRPGLLVNALRYEDRGAAGDAGHPRYAAVYDIVDPDPERAWPETKDHPSRQFHTSSPLLSVALRATYRRIEPFLPIGTAPLPQALTLVLCDCADPAAAQELDVWVTDRMRDLVARGEATHASRYALVEGAPAPPQYLEVYESDRAQGPDVSLGDRPASSTTRFFGSYARTFAYP